MIVTTTNIITLRPSTSVPTVKVRPSISNQVTSVVIGSTGLSPSACAFVPDSATCVVLSDGADTDLGALAGQTLAEGQDGEEGQRHQRRHQPGPVQDRGAHGQPLIASTSSRSIEERFRYSSRTMARPTATSAAATVMTNRA